MQFLVHNEFESHNWQEEPYWNFALAMYIVSVSV